MNLNSKADYYQWLMSEHGKISEMMRRIPKLSIEEQSKRVDLVEYDETNQKKINEYKRALLRLENEANRITRYL
mgnify:FL=1|tara:strand:- start:273 stop:494 length:222 start_codon:yes stop_codon:yes gene_type:complete